MPLERKHEKENEKKFERKKVDKRKKKTEDTSYTKYLYFERGKSNSTRMHEEYLAIHLSMSSMNGEHSTSEGEEGEYSFCTKI